DNDPAVKRGMSRLVNLCDDLVAALIARLGEPKSGAVRERLNELLLSESEVPAKARAALDHAPLIPGPSGEFAAVDDFRAELKAGRKLRFGVSAYPRGSYTPPALLFTAQTRRFANALPE